MKARFKWMVFILFKEMCPYISKIVLFSMYPSVSRVAESGMISWNKIQPPTPRVHSRGVLSIQATTNNFIGFHSVNSQWSWSWVCWQAVRITAQYTGVTWSVLRISISAQKRGVKVASYWYLKWIVFTMSYSDWDTFKLTELVIKQDSYLNIT